MLKQPSDMTEAKALNRALFDAHRLPAFAPIWKWLNDLLIEYDKMNRVDSSVDNWRLRQGKAQMLSGIIEAAENSTGVLDSLENIQRQKQNNF